MAMLSKLAIAVLSGAWGSRFSDRGLDSIIAKLEAMAEELERKKIRDEKIRKIEALRERCRALGLNISQQDLEAWADEPQNVVPNSETQFAQDSETTLMEDGPANSSSDTPAEVQTSLRSLRPLRRRKRSHSQLEEQGTASDADGDHDSDYVEAGGQSPSPDRTESLHSQDGGNIAAHANDAPTIPVHGSSVRTAWSVLVAKYPEEIALAFREGQRPTNSQLKAMVSPPTPA
ncbi:hypothetical protein DHEL01_v211140 [Diaporthe helianthi]|uniref:Uncharacterized protein n=1 Tax=Diaporthe helianthi TaxID=158607 RepID=A0A2P5HJN3_DIAHE|nr:hypothetical protein DHEL01_v211140 [Diaporthe helianthi]